MDIVITIEFVICLALVLGIIGYLIRMIKKTKQRKDEKT